MNAVSVYFYTYYHYNIGDVLILKPDFFINQQIGGIMGSIFPYIDWCAMSSGAIEWLEMSNVTNPKNIVK